MKNVYSTRAYVIRAVFIIVGIIFILRLFYLQIIDTELKLSSENNVLRHIIEYPARGLILDRYGKLLVYNEASYDLMVIPVEVKSFDTLEFCKLLGITKEQFMERFKKAVLFSRNKSSIFEKQLSKETYGYFQEKLYEFPGFYVQTRTLRKYPSATAAHMLGYIGEVDNNITNKNKYYKSGDYIGISGIERSYEEVLRGRRGKKIIMVDVFNQEKGSYLDGRYDTIAIAGKNLYTTTDAELQAYGELLMQNKRGSIVAIEPSTGEILVIISYPSYDPNLLVGRIRAENFKKLYADSVKPLFNRALMAQYPPGSTFKLLNALIGLHEGVLNVNTTFSCEGGFHFKRISVGCHNHSSPLNFIGSIQNSCNAYYCKAFRNIIDKSSFKTTKESYDYWKDCALSFGFGSIFNSDLPFELKGIIPSSKYFDKYYGEGRWNSLTIISLAIGQGEIAVTPLQLANFSATIANRGYYYTPHIVRAIGRKDSLYKKYNHIFYTKVESQYFDLVVEGMRKVVEAGTGTVARMDSIIVCAKTGTAQNPHGKDHSIFIAFAPMDNPRIAISVVVENAGFGATWAGPIASLMIEKYITRTIKRKDLEERMINGNLIYKN